MLRGDDRGELLRRVGALSDYLTAAGAPGRLTDLAYTLNRSVEDGGARLAIVASSLPELHARLRRAAERLADESCDQIKDVTGIYFVARPLAPQGKVAFLFPGEGAQYLGMLAGLADRFPVARAVYEVFDRRAQDHEQDKRPISRFTLSPDRWSASDIHQLEQDLAQIDNAMFSVYMADWAMFSVLERLDLKPSAVAGHSAGELAALALAGVFDLESRVGPLEGTMRALVGRGDSGSALLAVGTPRNALAEVIAAALAQDSELQACVAMDNCPHQSIAVGDSAAIAHVEAEATERGLMCERLDLARPYHTRWFEPYMGPLREMFAEVRFGRPTLPVYCCTTGALFPEDPAAIRELALAHWCAAGGVHTVDSHYAPRRRAPLRGSRSPE